jgi:hypothetical protein
MQGRSRRFLTLDVVAAVPGALIGLEAVYRGQLLGAVNGGFAAGSCWLAIGVTGILIYQKSRIKALRRIMIAHLSSLPFLIDIVAKVPEDRPRLRDLGPWP